MASPIAVAKKQASEMARLAEAMTSTAEATAEATAEITAVLAKIEQRLAVIEAQLTPNVKAPADEPVEETKAPAKTRRSSK